VSKHNLFAKKLFVGAILLLSGGCAQQNTISHVNQSPVFHPSLLSYAARDGAVPLEIHGALPAGMTAQEIAGMVHLPGRSEGIRLAAPQTVAPVSPTPAAFIEDRLQTMLGSDGHDFRIVLVFGPHIQTLPDRLCDAAEKIPASSGQDVRTMAAYCIGTHLAASGQMRVPASAAAPEGIAYAINLLLSDMSKPPADNGFGSGLERH